MKRTKFLNVGHAFLHIISSYNFLLFSLETSVTSRNYYVFVDSECVPISPMDFTEGLLVIFALHFIFNIKYNQGCARLLIFVEKFFLGHLTTKNRGEKTDDFQLGKVHRLISSIKKFIELDKMLKVSE